MNTNIPSKVETIFEKQNHGRCKEKQIGAYLKRSTLTHHSQTKIDQEDKDTEDLNNIFNKIDLID